MTSFELRAQPAGIHSPLNLSFVSTEPLSSSFPPLESTYGSDAPHATVTEAICLSGDCIEVDPEIGFTTDVVVNLDSSPPSQPEEVDSKKDDDLEGESNVEQDCEFEECEDEEDEQGNTPICVRLTFHSSNYDLFYSPSDGTTPALFGEQLTLFSGPLNVFMETLQSHWGIVNDIALFFPQLQLKFHTHMPFSEVSVRSSSRKQLTCLQSLSLLDLSFLASKANEDYDHVLLVTMDQEANNFVVQYNALLDLADGTSNKEEKITEY